MPKQVLKPVRGYDPKTQARLGWLAAQIDDQLRDLKHNVKDLSVKQLEWQQRPGMNTVGMLLAHLALVDMWWIKIATRGIQWKPEGQEIIIRTLGVEDDGIPLAADGKHPAYLKGFTAEKYINMLDKVRRIVHKELKTWKDTDLEKLYKLGEKREFSYSWTIYHILEHFCAHFGQIQLIKHMMRDAGVLKEAKKKK